MEIVYVVLSILQNIGISLGVGSSTLAIVNFFVAIADGKIDETERKMMGITYTLLRVAMILIALTTLALIIISTSALNYSPLTTYTSAQLLLILVLFINAILMTKRIMPSTFGPAIQAGSWYTLGILSALVPLGLTHFSLLQFGLTYLTVVLLGITLVNGLMAYLKANQHKA